MRRIILFSLLAILVAVPVLAAGAAPLDALSLGAGAGTVWVNDNAKPDVEAVGRAAFSLTPHVSMVGGLAYGFNGAYTRGSVGARLTATDVNDPNFSIGIGVSRHLVSEPGVGLDEWAGEAAVGWKPLAGSPVLVTALAAYGLDSGSRLLTAGVVWPIHLPKGVKP